MTDTPANPAPPTPSQPPPPKSPAHAVADVVQNVSAMAGAVALQCLVPGWPMEYTASIFLSVIGVPALAAGVPALAGVIGNRRGIGTATVALLGLTGAAAVWALSKAPILASIVTAAGRIGKV